MRIQLIDDLGPILGRGGCGQCCGGHDCSPSLILSARPPRTRDPVFAKQPRQRGSPFFLRWIPAFAGMSVENYALPPDSLRVCAIWARAAVAIKPESFMIVTRRKPMPI